jgi:hypothetical protein
MSASDNFWLESDLFMLLQNRIVLSEHNAFVSALVFA